MQKTKKLNKYDKNGVYQLEYPLMRFREHYNDYKYANNRSKFAQHLIDEGHAFCPMNDIMDIIHIANQRKMLDTLEKFYIYKETQSGNQINDKLTVQKNLIFEALIQHTPYRGQHPHM